MNFPDKKYKVLVCDPPWAYKNKKTGGTHKSGSIQKYDVMTFEELAELPIPSISDENSILFLWCTIPMLPTGFDLMKVWEFEYKTSLTWYKENSYGLGYWFRGMVEMLLIGVKGKRKPLKEILQ